MNKIIHNSQNIEIFLCFYFSRVFELISDRLAPHGAALYVCIGKKYADQLARSGFLTMFLILTKSKF